MHALALATPLLLGLGALVAVWLLLGGLMAWGASRADRLARHAPPACCRAAVPPPGPRLQLAFLGDLQRGVLDVPRALGPALAEAGTELLVSSGDVVSHGEGPYYGIALAAFGRAGLQVPVRAVPGNHDLWPSKNRDDRIGGAEFERAFGPRHWAVRTGPVLLVGLDDGAPYLLEDQIPWLEDTLAAHPDVPWIAVCHEAPWDFDHEDRRPLPGMEALADVLAARPPLLLVTGHRHAWHDETVRGVRTIVNAHGGDVHGLRLRRGPFEVVHVAVGPEGLALERRAYRRRLDWRTARDQLAVRFWADRRTRWGRWLAAPVHRLLTALGRAVPIERHPHERRIPDRETLRARRARPLERA